MYFYSSNNAEGYAQKLKEEIERELMEDVKLEEESGNSVEAQAPEAGREALASISTTPSHPGP